MEKLLLRLFTLLLLPISVAHAAPDWTENAAIPLEGRPNPYQLAPDEFTKSIRAGRLHSLHYPVGPTGVLLPYRPVKKFLDGPSDDPLRDLLRSIVTVFTDVHSFEDIEIWLGLQKYPESEGQGPYFIPFQDGQKPKHRMGFTLRETPLGSAFTISCAECHSSTLFGRPVLGMSNRFPRANRLFVQGIQAQDLVDADFFQWTTDATNGETELYRNFQSVAPYIGAKTPQQLGLDTSLAQVALSLARRGRDAWATRVPGHEPRPEKLRSDVADSKPAVWWTTKYKTRWLSDGSVVSGNPIFTNFIWNEIGRGADLKRLNDWLASNVQVVEELTTAVFSAEAPKYTDFFPAPDAAQVARGEILFDQHCAKCHGTYHGGEVRYPQPTRVMDVGTDPGRYLGMKSLEPLNKLEISRVNQIRIVPQKGYVPPPLVGIWARWPYFHNNSAPSLCAVLTRASARPKTYWARPADNPSRDFDRNCNGYPRVRPPGQVNEEYFFNTARRGLRNTGHDEGIFLRQGVELMSNSQKMDLIRYLQTL